MSKKKCAVSQFTKNCGWEEIQIKANFFFFFSGTCEMLKPCVEAGTNLLCHVLVRAELHRLCREESHFSCSCIKVSDLCE